MATLPTPEETATAILGIFVNHFQIRPGGVLMQHVLDTVCRSQGLDHRDLTAGQQFALDQGWLEFNGRVITLTESGFAAGGGVRHTEDELARVLMTILVGGRHRPGDIISPNRRMIVLWRKSQMHESDLSLAVQKSAERGWLSPVPRHGETCFEMTEAGFAAA